jgi:hypothetical protein
LYFQTGLDRTIAMQPYPLAYFQSEFEATLAKNAIEAHGIHASFAGGFALDGDPMGKTLVVDINDWHRATEILRKIKEQGTGHLDSTSPKELSEGFRKTLILLAITSGLLGVFQSCTR